MDCLDREMSKRVDLWYCDSPSCREKWRMIGTKPIQIDELRGFFFTVNVASLAAFTGTGSASYRYRERIHCTLEGGCLYIQRTNNYNVTCAIHNERLTLSVSGSGISAPGSLFGVDGNWMFSVPASVTELCVVQDWAEAEDPKTEALLAKRFKQQKSCVRFTSRRFNLDDW